MPPLDALTARAAADIKAATAALLNGGSTAAWRTAMERALTVAHTSAYIVGTAERLGVNVKTLKGLSRAERADIKAMAGPQLDYLASFVSAQSGLSDAQTAARAALYSGAVRSTYYGARFPGLPFMPGQGSECKTSCRCEWRDNGDGTYTWKLDESEHCPTCKRRAADNPYRIEG